MTDIKPYLTPTDFETTDLRHSSQKIGDYAYRVTLFNGQVLNNEITFGTIDVGATSPIVPLNVTNMGIKPLPIEAITVVGDFVISHNCPINGDLAKGEHCTINVQFAPLREGACTGGVYINTGDSMGTEFAKLNGVGIVEDPVITVTDALVVSTIHSGG